MGVCGVLLIPCIRMSWPGLLVIGAVLMRVPDVVPFGLALPSGEAADALIAQARQGLWHWRNRRDHGNSGGQETRALIVPLLVGVLPRTAGLMFWGMAAWRGGILREPEKHRGLLWAAFAVCGTLGAAATAEELWAKAVARPAWPPLAALSGAAVLLLAVGYVTGLLLWWRPGRAAWLSWFSAAGQMALNELPGSVLGAGLRFLRLRIRTVRASGAGGGSRYRTGCVCRSTGGEPGLAAAISVWAMRMAVAIVELRTTAGVARGLMGVPPAAREFEGSYSCNGNGLRLLLAGG